jgi:hypothetical protein
VNNQLAVGQLGSILECLADSQGQGGKRAAEQSSVLGDRLTLKQKECIRLYQSYLCTSSCPEYGVAVDFTYLCSDYCERLWQHCDDDLLDCLYDSQPLPFETCAPKTDSHCFRPKLIPVGSKFENDLCFYGSLSQCQTQDCVVELASETDVWPTETHCYQGHGPKPGFSLTQTGPACCTDERIGHKGWLYKIVSHGSPSGISCEDATHNDWVKRWGSAHNHGEVCTANYCVAVVEIGEEEEEMPWAGCASAADYNNCPGLSEYLYDDEAGYDCQGNPMFENDN